MDGFKLKLFIFTQIYKTRELTLNQYNSLHFLSNSKDQHTCKCNF